MTTIAIYSALTSMTILAAASVVSAAPSQGSYPKIEAAFHLTVTGNPFDYRQNDVIVKIRRPDAVTVSQPAFFDGGDTWRVRYTPRSPGAYTIVSISLNGKPAPTAAEPKKWSVKGKQGAGFLRLDKSNAGRFAFDNGSRYFPVGQNVAWGDTDTIFPKMKQAEENWARVWMASWAGNNLDWSSNGDDKNEPGQLSLDVAHKWDKIVDGAEANGIYFQLVLQHHGQYSSTTDTNWSSNPWNVKNGGFLATPEEFFTSERARTLTKAKYRYIVARWGYSPSIMSWELFNEVQWTDAIRNKHEADVLAWHKEMASFIRQQDLNRHLITTSSDQAIAGLFDNMDYLQHHDYPNDIIGSARNAVSAVSPLVGIKPDFGGEVGHGDTPPYSLRAVLFASLMANEAGAAQPWFWDVYDRDNLYSVFTPAARFVRVSGLAEQNNLVKTEPKVDTDARIDLVLRPGGGWVPTERHDFTLDGSNPPDSFYRFPAYFFGTNNRDMNPGPLVFNVNRASAGSMTMHIGQIGKGGAHITISVDGRTVAEQDFPAAEPETRTRVAIPVAIEAGKHTITIANSGTDWVNIGDFTFTGAVRALAAYGLSNSTWSAVWLYHRGQELSSDAPQTVSGKLSLDGLSPGRYRAVWWDTEAARAVGTPIMATASANGSLVLNTPEIRRDVALYVVKAAVQPKTAARRSTRGAKL